ncbi:hypothetical protein CCP3SC1AL1_640005 [Gammaproteobacteria bacterium]
MRSVAEDAVGTLPTTAEVDHAFCFGFVLYWAIGFGRGLVASVAKRSGLASPAGTTPAALASFYFDGIRLVLKQNIFH